MLKVSFHGAAKEVTGSCILIESENVKFLVDCGMFQGHGSYERNLNDFSFSPKEIDFVLLTHAHLDHCGRLPKLIKEGFKGRIYSTFATKDLTSIILQDSLRVFLRNEKTPLFYQSDLDKTLQMFVGIDYDTEVNINGVGVTARDAGHILGACMYEVLIEDKKIVFSGDLGNIDQPLVKDTYVPNSADVVFVESTYGGRIHENKQKGINLLLETIKETKGALLIPSFSLERTQELLYYLNDFVENKKIPFVKIFLDSPLAIKATRIFEKYSNLFDEDAKKLILKGDDIFDFDGLRETENIKQSMRIIKEDNPKIIIAGSGMCSGGRMPYYLKNYLGDSESTVLLISFQADGTLGRQIEDGGGVVRIDNKNISVKAKVKKIESFSSHADSLKLKDWVNLIKPKKVFITHGDLEQAKALKESINIKNSFIAELDNKFML